MDVLTARVPLHVRPKDDVVVILVLKSVARVIFSRYVALLHGHVLISRSHRRQCRPYPRVAHAQDISHESVVCVAVTTHSVDKMSPYVLFFRTNGGTRLAFKSRTVLATS
jgi:hypothetical protein